MSLLHADHLANGVIGGAHIAGDVDVRDVEHVRTLVEAVGFAILRKLALDLEPRRMEQIAEGVFVFVGVEAALGGASGDGGGFALGGGERRRREIAGRLFERRGRGGS